MTWEIRVVKVNAEGQQLFQVSEVFFDDEHQPYAYTEAVVVSEDYKEVTDYTLRMQQAFTKPSLAFPEDFKGKPPTAH